jgi:F0F1-type ATP synthase assembly protein I
MSERPKRNFSKFARLSGIGIQMGATIFLGAYLGKYLDERFPSNKKWFTIGCTLLAVALSLYNILRQVNKLNDEKEDD